MLAEYDSSELGEELCPVSSSFPLSVHKVYIRVSFLDKLLRWLPPFCSQRLMVKSCVVGCRADTRKLQRLAWHPWMKGLTFHKFPDVDEPFLRKKWLELVKRDDSFVPNKDSWLVPDKIKMYYTSIPKKN